MDKKILQEYMDACEVIKDAEREIKKLRAKKKTIVQTNVTGSNPEFPYQPQHFKIAGTTFRYEDDTRLRHEEKFLEEQKASAEEIKRKVEQWMPTIPTRMQRVIRYKCFDKLSWEEVAIKLGGKATGESVRKEFERFIK